MKFRYFYPVHFSFNFSFIFICAVIIGLPACRSIYNTVLVRVLVLHLTTTSDI